MWPSRRWRVAVEHGDGARLPLGDQHQVVQVAVVGRRVGQSGLVHQHLAAGGDLVQLPLDGLGRGLAADDSPPAPRSPRRSCPTGPQAGMTVPGLPFLMMSK